MAMTDFVQQNVGGLTEFFYESLNARNEFISSVNGYEWSVNHSEHKRLSELYVPHLNTTRTKLAGIHAQAYVFEDYVVKTNLFGQHPQEGQRQWLEWCQDNQDNPLVPKVAFLITDEPSDRYLVVMEKLACHSGFYHHERRKDIDRTLANSFLRQPLTAYPALTAILVDIKKNSELAVKELEADIELMHEINDKVVEQELKVNLLEHQIALQYIDEIECLWLSLRTVNSDNYNKIRSFWDTLCNKGHEIDVHSLNWMLRSNGEQVLLDPVN